MTDRQRHGFVLLLVAGLIAASAVVLTQFKTVLGLDLRGGVELVYQAQPTPQSPVNQTSLSRAVDIMRQRVDQLGVAEPEIQHSGGEGRSGSGGGRHGGDDSGGHGGDDDSGGGHGGGD
jgi:SecD/SecF fusion protein